MFWSSFSLGSVGKYVEAAMIVPAIIYCTHDMDVLYYIYTISIRTHANVHKAFSYRMQPSNSEI